jgi:hypothetical protein
VNVLLDEAAAYAMAGQQIDLDLVLRRAAEQRSLRVRRSRRRGGTVVLAIAAAVALVAVLFPSSGVLRGDAGPAGKMASVPAVTGLPASWYYAPVWTPPVTRHPMAAAVMVLSAPLTSGPAGPSGQRRGPVLVSADAATYASLPDWGDHDGGVTLSPDGRQVAWWTAPPARSGSIVVHRLVLATGRQQDTTIRPGVPLSMTFAGDDLYVSGRAHPAVAGPDGVVPPLNTRTSWRGVYRISSAGAAEFVCRCSPSQLGVDGAGRLFESGNLSSTPMVPGAGLLWDSTGVTGDEPVGPEVTVDVVTGDVVTGAVVAPRLVVSPDGRRSAALGKDKDGVQVVRLRTSPFLANLSGSIGRAILEGTSVDAERADVSFPLTADEPITSVSLLSWTAAGVLLHVQTSDGLGKHHSIRMLDPQTGASRIISRPRETTVTIPVAIATALVGTDQAIPAARPSFDGRDRAHLAFLAATGWSYYGQLVKALALIALAVAGLVLWRYRSIRARRRAATDTAETAEF